MSYNKLLNGSNDWKTGDIILFHNPSNSKNCFGRLIQYFSGSKYSHVGMILKNPDFTKTPLIGLYFWESSDENFPDAEDHKKKIGVEIVNLDELINRCGDIELYYRKLNLLNGKFIDTSKFKEIHNTVHNKPYDIVPQDWIEAFFKVNSRPQKKDRFWCSALLGYIYVQLELLPPNIDWSIMTPGDFSTERTDLPLISACLEKETRIK